MYSGTFWGQRIGFGKGTKCAMLDIIHCLRKNVVSNFLRHGVFADAKSVDETTEAAELVA